MTTFDKAAGEALLADVFATWVKQLELKLESVDTEGAVLRLPFAESLCRDNGVICGQALMTLADTAMVLAISGAAGGYLPMTTVDQSIHFLRPASRVDLLANASVVRLGRTMAFGTVAIGTAEPTPRSIAIAQTAYALQRKES